MHIDSEVGRATASTMTVPPRSAAARCPVHRPTGCGDPTPEAVEFLLRYATERQQAPLESARRIAQVVDEIAETGTYWQTENELKFGTELAWRQSVRCVGRSRWRSLRLRDRRSVRTVEGIAAELVGHIGVATNGGRIRNTITVFAPDHPVAGPRARIWNDQLIRYAGYRDGGQVLGDPAQLGMTETAATLGWTPPTPPGPYDVLPWVIETADQSPRLFAVPDRILLEVELSHPDHPWFVELGLRWHALPVISSMRLRIGGVHYSCAPFNGFYLADEIATRNFGDTDRYNKLPLIASRLGLDTRSRTSMWREHAALVLNQAVLHSFVAARVSIADGGTESLLFRQFAEREEAAGRAAYADWSWVNGHFGHSLGPAFHRYYDPTEQPTNFWSDPDRISGPSLLARHAAAGVRTD